VLGILGSFALQSLKFAFSLFYTAKKPYHDDSDSGVGPSISTGRKRTTVSEVIV